MEEPQNTEDSGFWSSESKQYPHFQWTAKQEHVAQMLKRIDEILPVLYFGGWDAFRREQHDYLAQSAHSFRELMDKIALSFLGKKLPGTNQELTNKVFPTWDRYEQVNQQTPVQAKEPLKAFLLEFASFRSWFAVYHTTRRKRSASALEQLRRGVAIPDDFESDNKSWHELNDTFTGISHHNRRSDINKESFFDLITRLEGLLLKYVRGLESHKLVGIQKMVAEAGALPSHQDLKNILSLVDSLGDVSVFLEAIKDARWLRLLIESNWLESKSSDAEKDLLQVRALQCDFLTRFVKSHPNKVAEALKQLTHSKDPWLGREILTVASDLSCDLAKKFVPVAVIYASNCRDAVIYAPLEAFLKTIGLDQTIIRTVLQFEPDREYDAKLLTKNDSEAQLSYPRPEPSPKWEVYYYKHFLEFLAKEAIEANASIEILEILVSCVVEGIELGILPEKIKEQNGNDGSTYWRSAIEPHEQNHDYGHKEQLVTAIRDFSEYLLENNPNSKEEVVSLLTQSKWFVFTRLRLHLYRKFPELFQSEIRASLLDPELREERGIWHEWALLFSEQFNRQDAQVQDDLFAWIERGDDLQPSIDFYKSRNEGAEPSQDMLAVWQGHWQLRRLSLIKNDLTGHWKQKYEGLASKHGPFDEPDLLHSTSGFGPIPEISPISADHLQTMSVFEIVGSLRDWVQTDRFDGPSESGLHGSLKQDAKRDPEKYLSNPEAISQFATDRLVAVLSACFEVANEGAPINWSQFLSYIHKIAQERILPDANTVDPDTGYLGDGIDLIRNLEAALEKQPAVIPVECRAKAWDVILLFLQHPDPCKDRKIEKSGPFDLISQSLNTVRGVAFRCVFIYANWVRRQTAAGNAENPAVEILDALDDRLLHDKALSIRAVFGEQFPWLLHFHHEWTIERISQIFPSDPESALKRAAAWESFLVYAQTSDSLFAAMGSLYREAVLGLSGLKPTEEKSSRHDTPTKGLVHHLMALYWFGNLPIEEGSLVWDFYQIAPVWLRSYSLEYIGRSLSNTKGEVPARVAKRFVNLADWRVETLKTQSEQERQELEGFLSWVPSLKLEEDWLFQTTASVLQLIGTWTNYYHHSLFEPLAAYSTKNPLLAVQCLSEMLKREEGYGLWGNEGEIKAILRNARDSHNDAAIRLHEDVQDALLRKNQLQFLSLDADPKKGL
jgi:hypothetical protein